MTSGPSPLSFALAFSVVLLVQAISIAEEVEEEDAQLD